MRSRLRRVLRSDAVLLAPAVLLLLVLTGWPLVRAVVASLRRTALTVPGDDAFVGLDTFAGVLSSRQWWLAVAATLLLVVVVVALQLLLAAVLAASLRRLVLPSPLSAVLLLAPFALLSVATATIWRDALTTGFAPQWFGYDGGSTTAAVVAVVVAEVWRGTGVTTLVLLAGLRGVDRSLLDSVVADGATWWQRLRRVTWPVVAPAVAVAVAWRSLDALRAFEAPLLAEPATTLRTVPLLVWDSSFQAFELGLGAATSLLLLVLAAVAGGLLALVVRVGRTS